MVQDDQWWDQVVWLTAAWNHYLVTGDRAFLSDAFQTARNTLGTRRAANYNVTYGLFQGPSFFNDGIAGYPAPPADATESHGSFVLGYPTAGDLALSTNALYYSAYRSAARMAEAPGQSPTALDSAAEALKSNINRYFWIAAKGTYGYLIHNGQLDQSEEGTGQSFAVLFGIASTDQARLVMRNSHIQPYGIVDVWPHFARYSDSRPGRHNVSVWPMIQGYWAEAAARAGDPARFASETLTLAALANTSGGFYEIYNFRSGAPDGGWQTGSHWGPLADQTWSATAYLRMIYSGLFGLQFTTTGLAFRPTLPSGWGDVRLSGLRYRGAVLDLALHGAGTVITDVRLDGTPTTARSVPATLTGTHTLDITLSAGAPGPVRGYGNLCLDVNNAATANGTPIQLWGCNGTNAQQWTGAAGGTLRVLGKCLDVSNGGTANGTPVQLWDCNNTGAQAWVPRADGSLRNPQSGRCLDDPNASTAWGTRPQLRDCDGTAAQRWFLPG
ncbi:ricin-type beta-trefoil lectin domain protein [Dactylosporangium sp. CS-047395]|uniref:ricin-type beta-trefoil lectin domain protein n=1 Tax=Dactylosporangium sp. CS-047395 TaxID=3239936 RepID=UPI003D8B2B16